MPLGPMIMYGLLGAHYRPQPGGTELAVDVGCTEAKARASFATLSVVKPEVARKGLPREFGDSVLQGVDDALRERAGLGPGVLFFDCAASGDIGSSPIAFRTLARAVTTVFAAGAEDEAGIRTALADLF